MAGIDDNVALAANWGLPSPSPRTIFSRMLGEDDATRPQILETPGSATTKELFQGTQDPNSTGKSNINDRMEDGASSGQLTDTSLLSEQKPSSRGGLVERMAARAGFNAPRLNTESIKPADLLLNSDVQSPYLTIPPGLSPTTLLDSSMFLPNSLAQPSPTTGKFPFISNGNIRCSELSSDAPDKSKDNSFDDIYTSPFAFKPTTDLGSTFYHGAARKMNPTTLHQSLPGFEVSVQSENYFQCQGVESVKDPNENKSGLHLQANFIDLSLQKDNATNFVSADQRTSDTVCGSTEQSTPFEEKEDEVGEQGGNGDPMIAGVGGAPSEDGYNWRKYGQKQVKGSEYPRSYYKCTHPNCQVKKKVERSLEGHITEIIYKGVHSHSKPPSNRRSAIGSVNPLADMHGEYAEHIEQESCNNGDLHLTSAQKVNVAVAAEWKHDNREVTLASVVPENCNQSSYLQTQNGTHLETGDAVDMSSTFSNDEEEDDRGTHGSVSLGCDGEGDESESKRRKLESSYATELSGAPRAIREPRVVVQTTSEVDILDDGYRWRKYGQKVVKGNPNPRSYYKCTNAGCTVRKHVERASHDVKSVITTYEGKHNHDVPAARTSSHVNANATAQASTGIQTHQVHNHRSEASQVQIQRPATLPLGSGSFNLPGTGRQQHLVPSHGFTFGMPGFGPLMSVHHPFLPQQHSANEMGYLMQKGEPNMEPTPEHGLNLPTTSSVYQEIMSRMPLGPHM